MDRKEAADLLDNLIGMVEDSHGADYDTALRMGIEALTAQPDPDKLHLQKEQAYMQGWEDARLIDRQAIRDAQPERKKDIIQKFHDYQVEWLKNHYDIELEPQLEELIVRFLHDTANMYMLEMERRADETD